MSFTRKLSWLLIAACFVSTTAFAAAPAKAKATKANPVVVMETSLGTVEMELYPDKAPLSVANFLSYVKDKFYDGTVFHRVIKGFMIQGGGFDTSYHQKATKAPIKNEATNGLKNDRGTLAMARTMVVDSATAQFFINVVDNAMLNNRGTDMQSYGYAVFGKVIKGMDVVDKIRESPTGSCGSFPTDCPKTPVVIKKMRVK